MPVLPMLFSTKDALVTVLTAGPMFILVSTLAFCTGSRSNALSCSSLVIVTVAFSMSYTDWTRSETEQRDCRLTGGPLSQIPQKAMSRREAAGGGRTGAYPHQGYGSRSCELQSPAGGVFIVLR